MDQNTALSLAKTVWDYMDAQAASVEAGDDQGGVSRSWDLHIAAATIQGSRREKI